MSDQYGFSDLECKIIMTQIERRAKRREEFLKLRSDPCKHSQQSGYVFDPAIQRYLSMKACQLDNFQPSAASARFAILSFLPMFIYGYILWNDRAKKERKIRCGITKYKDRLFIFQ